MRRLLLVDLVALVPLIGLSAPVALAGCDLDFELDFSGPTAHLSSDAGQLTIWGCSSAGLLSCTDSDPSTGRMQVVLDGIRREVPHHIPSDTALFPDRSFQLVAPSPEDPYLWVILNGVEVKVEELPWFDLEAPATVQRAQGSVTLVYQAYPKATVDVVMTSECGAFKAVESFDRLAEDGRVQVPLTNAGFAGECTHDLELTQTLVVPAGNPIGLQISRVEHAAVTSTR